jgi:hypothetical protein
MAGFKSEKDKEAFAKELAEAGFSPEDIQAEVSNIESLSVQRTKAPVAPPIAPSTQMGGGQADATVAPPLAPATPAAVQQQAADLTAAREEAGNTLSDQLFTADTAKLLAPVAAYGVYKGAQAIKDRMFSSDRPQYPTGVEPTMSAEPSTPENKLPTAAQQPRLNPTDLNPTDQALLEASERNAPIRQEYLNRTQPYAGGTPTNVIPQPVAPPSGTATPFEELKISNQPTLTAPELPAERIVNGVKMTEPQYQYYISQSTPGLSPAQSIEEMNAKAATPVAPIEEIKPAPTAETPKGSAPPPEGKKKGGRPAAGSVEATTFRPDLGPGDNWLYNTAGPERRKLILQEFNEGKPAKTQEAAVKLYQEYKKKYPKDMFGPVIPTDVAMERGVKPPENYGKLGKAAKVGGVAGLALTAAEMANAAQQSSKGNNAPLRESIFNLLGMIPGLGTAFSAGTYSGGLNENQEAELTRRRQMPPTITKR